MENIIIRDIQNYTNELGVLNYCNSLVLNKYKRFYFITHPNTNTVRAWQGHPLEGKCFIPIKGRFLLSWVKIDCFKNPSLNLIPETLILDSNKKKLIEIPKGYANGLKALDDNSELLVFSELNLEESIIDNIRFDSKLWLDWSELT
tara:strand:- start:237 stop:674 length:438 start_codon:yes stop_codon:yes gene_type:complete